MQKVNFAVLFRGANPDALDLMERMLAFDPSRRIGVEDALEHRYLAIWHDASDEPACPTQFDFHFEVVEDIAEMKKMILAEVQRFRQTVRQPLQQQQMGQQQGMQSAQQQVPIPEHYDPRAYENPRPQEAVMQGGLEGELQGLDAHGHAHPGHHQQHHGHPHGDHQMR